MFFENTGWRVTTSRLLDSSTCDNLQIIFSEFWIYIVSYLVKNFKKRKKEKGSEWQDLKFAKLSTTIQVPLL